MGRSFHLLLAVSILHLPTPAQDDPKLKEALYRLSREASQFWQTAPGFVGRETINQRVLTYQRKRGKAEDISPDVKGKPRFKTQQIVSWYAFGSLRGSPEAVREFRRIYEIDGKPIDREAVAKSSFMADIASHEDEAKENLLKQFEKEILPGAATDFGQLVLLFSKTKLDKYSFQLTGESRVGADAALVIDFKQVAGNQALRIQDGGKKLAEKLQGQILAREGDYLPLRIALNSTREHKKNHIRDEAIVDYAVSAGALLPASLTYRRFLNGDLIVESTYRYMSWEPLKK
jgi:hypothetical protein